MKKMLVVAVMLLLSNGIAVAGSITFDLGTGNSAISGYTGPYAAVTINLINPAQATITFASLNNGSNLFLMGDGGTVAVDINASSWVLGTVFGSNSAAGFTPGPWSNGGAGNEDGFGSFNQKIDSFDGYTHTSTNISFTVTDTSGTWASASQVLVANADGYAAGAHIFVCNGIGTNCNASNGALATGFAAGIPGGTPTLAEPSSLLVLCSGLSCLGFVLRRHVANLQRVLDTGKQIVIG